MRCAEERPDSSRGRGERGSALSVVGVAVLILFLVGMLAVVVALTFSVRVSGHSMMPTLRDGDRLEVDVLHRHDIARFDLVQATEPGEERFGGGQEIVKRVIGLPGDRVAIAPGAAGPKVEIRPAGSRTTYVVDNPAWPAQVGNAVAPCCTARGTSSDRRTWATVPDGSYWLLGDNWGGSTDSRVFGFVTEDDVQARLSFRILPRGRFGRIGNNVRLVSQKN